MPRLLSDEEITEGLAGIDWTRDGAELEKQVKLKDFAGALDFVNKVGALAEDRNHHPDMAISWNTVTLRVSTHSEGGLTRLDFELAAAIDALST